MFSHFHITNFPWEDSEIYQLRLIFIVDSRASLGLLDNQSFCFQGGIPVRNLSGFFLTKLTVADRDMRHTL